MQAELIDYLGDDLTVVNAAKVSFAKESSYAELNGPDPDQWVLKDKDARLIRYLAEHNHWTPFAHATITMRETVPLFVARQRFKHTVGFVYNEISRRYVKDEPEIFFPKEWRTAPEGSIKQGSGDAVSAELQYTTDIEYEEAVLSCLSVYDNMISNGIAPEQARMVLPQSMYTSYYVTGSLAAFSRAYGLRHQSDAMKEIQELATQWDKIISELFPYSWKALTQ